MLLSRQLLISTCKQSQSHLIPRLQKPQLTLPSPAAPSSPHSTQPKPPTFPPRHQRHLPAPCSVSRRNGPNPQNTHPPIQLCIQLCLRAYNRLYRTMITNTSQRRLGTRRFRRKYRRRSLVKSVLLIVLRQRLWAPRLVRAQLRERREWRLLDSLGLLGSLLRCKRCGRMLE